MNYSVVTMTSFALFVSRKEGKVNSVRKKTERETLDGRRFCETIQNRKVRKLVNSQINIERQALSGTQKHHRSLEGNRERVCP
jgi:hypothetical protein